MRYSKSKKSPERYKKISNREFRLADQIKKDVANIIQTELGDPRVKNITITDVEISSDLSHAKVFYSVYPSTNENISDAKNGVEKSKGYIRSKLGKSLTLHRIPVLSFYFDNSLHVGQYLTKLIKKANEEIKK